MRRPRFHINSATALAAAALLFVTALLAGGITPASAATNYGYPDCMAAPQHVVRPFSSGTTIHAQYGVDAPPANTTYDLSGVTSTNYPATVSAFAFGSGTPGKDNCLKGGKLQGTVDPKKTWEFYHGTYNAACVKLLGTDWFQVRGTRCDSVEDGLRPEETSGNRNVMRFYVTGTYLSNVRDDCMENDFTVGGVLQDNLWEQCNTGISERPASSNGTWTSPASETVTLDHMLIGLYPTLHSTGTGENALFKWSTSANHLVIKCSTFKVDSVSLNGASSNDIPAGTVVDDSACPNNPTTIVWLGRGAYPGNLHGLPIKVTSSAAVWTNAVASWKTAHGY